MARYSPGKDLYIRNGLEGECGVKACFIAVKACFYHALGRLRIVRVVASAERDSFDDLGALWVRGRVADRAGFAGALSFFWVKVSREWNRPRLR